MNAVDRRAVDWVVRRQTNVVQDEYGRRVAGLSVSHPAALYLLTGS